MSRYGAHPAPGAGGASLDYRVAHLADHLAAGDLGELGVRIEIRGEAVLLTGTVPSAQCRDDVLRMARQELPGTLVHSDIMVADTSAPDHAEEVE
ncbi:BON domain-containing protein [Streptomyces sp. ISL-22]|uniref:BON domain-containing protein n=1 Tax=unclassified Streptomyces TaxID=2593676 RepID=UPI001BE80329|nr:MULTISPECIES: BON domain-containing protein [unclassified Streptomyces]MBT2423352.1 BON domain-containing protein [Streptomyces sp. ISL-24]MBT2436622.1 BON domain-containing protein [Streptomyces sp. ISL-22]